jgi:AcrR family transcriptional regulator
MARKILRSAKKSDSLIRDRDLLQQKREAVAEAALELFLKEGFHRTTTRDIARRAGVSAGAPFTYFKDKEDILFHIVNKEQDRGEAIHYGMVLAHAWATRHWAFAGEIGSIEEYIALLQPLVLAMLETIAAGEKPKRERQQPTVIGGSE